MIHARVSQQSSDSDRVPPARRYRRSMAISDSAAATHRARIRVFLERVADRFPDNPIIALREKYGRTLGLVITWESQGDGTFAVSDLETPDLERRILESAIVDCRALFAQKDTCYLPSVLKAYKSLVGPERARKLTELSQLVNAVVRDGKLTSPVMYSGRLEEDNGLGPGRLLGDDQIAMDYIYGVAFHDDPERAQRLANVSDTATVRFAVILQLNQLIYAAECLRDQIHHDVEARYLRLDE